jgi:hypothetical protein
MDSSSNSIAVRVVVMIVGLTSKYGLQAERTTLWAFRYFPSAASVQSTSVPDSSNVSKFCIRVDWWLFHLRQNCWSSSIILRFCGAKAKRWDR